MAKKDPVTHFGFEMWRGNVLKLIEYVLPALRQLPAGHAPRLKLSIPDERDGAPLQVTAVGSVLSMQACQEVNVYRQGGCVVDAARLRNLVAQMPEDLLQFKLHDDTLTISSAATRGTHLPAASRKFQIQTQGTAGYPGMYDWPVEDEGLTKIPSAALANAIELTRFACLKDSGKGSRDNREHLKSTLLVIQPGSLTAVALDGAALGYYTAKVEIKGQAELFIPSAMHDVILGLCAEWEDIMMGVIDGHLFVHGGPLLCVHQLPHNTNAFPPWQRLLQQEVSGAQSCIVDGGQLRAAINAISVAAGGIGSADITVELEQGGKGLLLKTHRSTGSGAKKDEEAGPMSDAEERLNVTAAADASFRVLLAANYLAAAAAGTDTAILRCGPDELDPVTVRRQDDTFRAILMPLRP